MEKLNRPLNQVLGKWGLRQHVKERMALYVWPEAAGSKLSSCTRAAAVKEGILFVQVPNSSWAQHLTFFKGTLLKKINRLLQGNVIKDIRFQVGVVEKEEKLTPGGGQEEIDLDEGERKKLREMFADFQGEDIMREKLMQLMEKEMLSRKRKAAEGWLLCPQCGSYMPPQGLCPLCKL
jgi:hypothetical protein